MCAGDYYHEIFFSAHFPSTGDASGNYISKVALILDGNVVASDDQTQTNPLTEFDRYYQLYWKGKIDPLADGEFSIQLTYVNPNDGITIPANSYAWGERVYGPDFPVAANLDGSCIIP